MQKEKNDKEEQRQIRLQKKRERSRSSRTNETEEQRQIRLEKKREQTRSSRTNETEEQHQIRLEQQRKRSQMNRVKKKLEKETYENINNEQERAEMQFNETEGCTPCNSSNTNGFTQNENISKKQQNFIRPPWPKPIPRDLKETRLQQFLQKMSMSVLAEATCAVCNIRTPAKDSKKVPISKIPNIHLLKVSEELKNLIKNTSGGTEIFANDNNINMIEHAKSNI
jgi:hypothetical protein